MYLWRTGSAQYIALREYDRILSEVHTVFEIFLKAKDPVCQRGYMTRSCQRGTRLIGCLLQTCTQSIPKEVSTDNQIFLIHREYLQQRIPQKGVHGWWDLFLYSREDHVQGKLITEKEYCHQVNLCNVGYFYREKNPVGRAFYQGCRSGPFSAGSGIAEF